MGPASFRLTEPVPDPLVFRLEKPAAWTTARPVLRERPPPPPSPPAGRSKAPRLAMFAILSGRPFAVTPFGSPNPPVCTARVRDPISPASATLSENAPVRTAGLGAVAGAGAAGRSNPALFTGSGAFGFGNSTFGSLIATGFGNSGRGVSVCAGTGTRAFGGATRGTR